MALKMAVSQQQAEKTERKLRPLYGEERLPASQLAFRHGVVDLCTVIMYIELRVKHDSFHRCCG